MQDIDGLAGILCLFTLGIILFGPFYLYTININTTIYTTNGSVGAVQFVQALPYLYLVGLILALTFVIGRRYGK